MSPHYSFDSKLPRRTVCFANMRTLEKSALVDLAATFGETQQGTIATDKANALRKCREIIALRREVEPSNKETAADMLDRLHAEAAFLVARNLRAIEALTLELADGKSRNVTQARIDEIIERERRPRRRAAV